MASTFTSTSTNIDVPAPPIFGGDNYDYWCIKMKLFLRANELWEIVESGVDQRQEGVQYEEAQLKKLKEDELKDVKALAHIHIALVDTIFSRIMRAASAKEAWSILQDEFQGNDKVRITKLNTLRREFENLKMKENESVKDYTFRMIEVVNQMKIYGEITFDQRIVQKVSSSLTQNFFIEVTIIEESKDLTKLSSTELFGSLLAHEQKLGKNSESPSKGSFQSKHKSKIEKIGGKGKFNKSTSNGGYADGAKNQEPQKKEKFQPCGICGKTNHSEKDC
ncbi:uncharacterized protein [Elaeis guineensis]|uniref:uncharacterized protein n=1 Tax=Elaeis guineensis var. tenera TaxID=51953 RepID=UPI003C6D9E85